MVLKLVLGKKDNLLKEWCICAREEDLNVSLIVCKAVEYYVKTHDYLQIGKIEKENSICKIDKNIYYQEGSILDSQIIEWKEKGIRPSSEVKRILKKGILMSEKETIISEMDAYDAVEAVSDDNNVQFIKPDTTKVKAVQQKPAPASEKKIEKEEPARSKPSKEAVNKPPLDFVTSLIAEGCGLGED